jgi:hypothetical protein
VQPTWLDTQSAFDLLAVRHAEQPFARAVFRSLLAADSGPLKREMLGQLALQCAVERRHHAEIGGAPVIDPMPKLFRTELRTLRPLHNA